MAEVNYENKMFLCYLMIKFILFTISSKFLIIHSVIFSGLSLYQPKCVTRVRVRVYSQVYKPNFVLLVGAFDEKKRDYLSSSSS
jgi:hypothetical protein